MVTLEMVTEEWMNDIASKERKYKRKRTYAVLRVVLLLIVIGIVSLVSMIVFLWNVSTMVVGAMM